MRWLNEIVLDYAVPFGRDYLPPLRFHPMQIRSNAKRHRSNQPLMERQGNESRRPILDQLKRDAPRGPRKRPV